MKKLKADPAAMKKFLRYHVVMGNQLTAAQLKNTRARSGTWAGEPITIDGSGPAVRIDESSVKKADFLARNGVVHILDAPLLAPSLAERVLEPLMAAPGAEQPRAATGAAEKALSETNKAGAAPAAPSASSAASPEKKSLWRRLFGG